LPDLRNTRGPEGKKKVPSKIKMLGKGHRNASRCKKLEKKARSCRKRKKESHIGEKGGANLWLGGGMESKFKGGKKKLADRRKE